MCNVQRKFPMPFATKWKRIRSEMRRNLLLLSGFAARFLNLS